MAGLHQVRQKTDVLDAAGNTTAAIGKGFAIGSAALVSLALFGAFVTEARIDNLSILHPLTFSFLVIGAMLPIWFSGISRCSISILVVFCLHSFFERSLFSVRMLVQ